MTCVLHVLSKDLGLTLHSVKQFNYQMSNLNT